MGMTTDVVSVSSSEVRALNPSNQAWMDDGSARAGAAIGTVGAAEEEPRQASQKPMEVMRTASAGKSSANMEQDSAPSANILAPSYLDSVLGTEFAGADAKGDGDDVSSCGTESGATSPRSDSGIESDRPSGKIGCVAAVEIPSTPRSPGIGAKCTYYATKVADNKVVSGFFMSLTFYALFAPDIDGCVGNKDSKVGLSIVTTAVVFLFMIEMTLSCISKANYFCRAYFWLDLVALLSLLPDTYLVEQMSKNSAFVAGRSSRLTRIIRVASRSSKAARLNRLSRIVRVAALMPRIQKFFGRKPAQDDTLRLLDKKLHRIFCFLDEDMDGAITKPAALVCIDKLRTMSGGKGAASKWAAKVKGRIGGGQNQNNPRSSAVRKPTSDNIGGKPGTVAPLSLTDSQNGTASVDTAAVASKLGAPDAYQSPRESDPGGKEASEQLECRGDDDNNGGGIEMQVDFDTFKKMVLEDAVVFSGLKKSCQVQLKKGNNMQNVTSKNSEYIGVKVALCVLMLLFILSFVEPTAVNDSLEQGLTTIDDLVKKMNYTQTDGIQVPWLIQQQVQMWTKGRDDWGKDRALIFLDIQQHTYCDDIKGGSECTLYNNTDLRWQSRLALSEVDKALKGSDHRRVDLVLLRIPDFADVEISADDLERRTTAVAVLNGRAATVKSAQMSLITTCFVIVVILSGITMLTKDLTFLSRGLLKPLVELADEMESITRLQLAGVSGSEDTSKQEDLSESNVSEIRLIRKTFENMKRAIKSWGKYVPWPVVQLLLRRDVEAGIDVQEKEVSIYFSDIASFTTIVESLPPESSLLLLSRYFHDMSKTIDEFGGIVLEFIGDAIMAIYGAPVRNEDHPAAAVRSAIRMHEQLVTMNRWFAERSLPQVSIRCGVHTGRVVVGNMGFQSRMKYGVVGEESEIPARLEEMNKNYNTNMLISHATYSRINPNAFIIRPIDYVYLLESQGTDAECQLVYNVMDRERSGNTGTPKRTAANLHTAAMEAYRGRDFETAHSKFKQVNNLMQDITGADEDLPSVIFMKRCKHYMENPPPATWQGFWDQGK